MKTEDKNYKKIEFGFGGIDEAICMLQEYQERGELVFGSFNGKKLYSDIDDLDSAYLKITGYNKADFIIEQKKRYDERQEEKRKHQEAIPQLTIEWIEKGNVILDEKYCELWAKCVPVRLDDLYEGFELGACLEIVKPLNDGCTFDEANAIIEKQGHSGMSFSLVCSMVASFCDRGAEFVTYARKN
jgi:hypothetical protein